VSEVRIVTCAGGAAWEAPLVRGLQRRELGIELVRRCVDHGELLGIALRDRPRAALVAAELPWLDRDLVGTLQDAGVAVVAIDSLGGRPLDRLGVSRVLDADATVEAVVAHLHGIGGDSAPSVRPPDADEVSGLNGRVVAVWGGPGAPGRTTVSVHLAVEAARSGAKVVLVDADPWAPAVAQVLGLAESPSVAQAARLAAEGWPESLASCLQVGPDGVAVLAGLAHPDLWPEIRDHAWRAVVDAARAQAGLVIVDVGAPVEEDEELAFDRVPYRRNLMTLTALESATDVFLVAAADPVAVRRAVVAHRALQQVRPAVARRTKVVLNRAPRSPRRLQECSTLLAEWTGAPPLAFLPVERAFDRCVWEGRTLRAVAPRSAWLRELHALVTAVV